MEKVREAELRILYWKEGLTMKEIRKILEGGLSLEEIAEKGLVIIR